MHSSERLLAAGTGVLIGVCVALAVVGLLGALGPGVLDWMLMSTIAIAAGLAAIVLGFLWYRVRTHRSS